MAYPQFDRGSCTARAVPAHIFASTFAGTKSHAGPLPSATPPKEMAVFALVAGVNHRVAAFGYRGGHCSSDANFRWPGPW